MTSEEWAIEKAVMQNASDHRLMPTAASKMIAGGINQMKGNYPSLCSHCIRKYSATMLSGYCLSDHTCEGCHRVCDCAITMINKPDTILQHLSDILQSETEGNQ